MYKKLNSLLTKYDKLFLGLLVCFSILIALVETISIAAIMPFISVASNFDIIQKNEYYKYVYNFFNFDSNIKFVITFGISLIIFYMLRGIFIFCYIYTLSKFSKEYMHLLSVRLFKKYLDMDYYSFINKNSGKLSKVIINETQYLSLLISSILLIISEIFVVIFIYSAMLLIDWRITLTITIFLLLNVLFFVKIISKKIKLQGILREKFQKEFYEIINSAFGNYKIIKLQSNDKIILDKFNIASFGFARSGVIYESLSQFPKIFLETLGFGLITLAAVYLVFKYQTNISNVLGILSMFVLGLYRLLPSANRLFTSYNQIMYYHRSLDLIHDDLMSDCESLGVKTVSFNENIKLKNIKFRYNRNKTILDNISLEIKKGEKIAFIGPSGSGKSTLVDIIIGLYRPNEGQIFVDNSIIDESNIRDWRKKVGYIPQSIYLFDGTVAENISFGSKFNKDKIKDVLKKAKILDFLETHQNGIDTFVGEGGIKLSGGQKQRIAIARALYQEPEILVLDEATSALDEKVEKEIMDEIYDISKNKTLIIIAHRLSTIKRCEKIYRIENKKLVLQ
nr:ABC transporter ATP-binding protein [Campylobacter hyointestinalis]